jgi:hypothetical protein
MKALGGYAAVGIASAMFALNSPDIEAKGSGARSSSARGGTTTVRGHTRKDGAYVAPHHRTAPDSSKSNNWSSKGNSNPYTGKAGTVDPNRPRTPRR